LLPVKRCVYTVAFIRGGLGWGNLRTCSDSITCVYTVACEGRRVRLLLLPLPS
jgi:hypothetical protein